MKPSELIDAALAVAFVPELRRRGYKKTRRTFRRVERDAFLIVDVQASAFNRGYDETRCTINYGLHFPAVHEIMYGERVDLAKAVPTSPFFGRIGYRMPGGIDTWWTLSGERDCEAVGTAIRDAFVQHLEPYLVQHADLGVARGAAPNWYELQAAAAVALGDLAGARKFVRTALIEIRATPNAVYVGYEDSAAREAELRAWARRAKLLI